MEAKNIAGRSIIDVADGEIIRKLDYELDKIVANINDINTDDKARKIKIDLTLKPTKDKKMINLTANITSTPRPTEKTEVTLFNQKSMDSQTGEIKNVLQEMTDVAVGQINFDGIIQEAPKPILVGYTINE